MKLYHVSNLNAIKLVLYPLFLVAGAGLSSRASGSLRASVFWRRTASWSWWRRRTRTTRRSGSLSWRTSSSVLLFLFQTNIPIYSQLSAFNLITLISIECFLSIPSVLKGNKSVSFALLGNLIKSYGNTRHTTILGEKISNFFFSVLIWQVANKQGRRIFSVVLVTQNARRSSSKTRRRSSSIRRRSSSVTGRRTAVSAISSFSIR